MVKPMTPDDTELLRRYVREGAKDAFGELVQRHLGVVYHAALRQVGGDTHRAEEVAQEVFTLLARKAESLTEHPMLIGWLFSATQRTAWRLLRAERRRLQREHEAWAMRAGDFESGEENWEALRPVLDEAINQLKPAERDALLLRYFQEQPFSEIGQRFAVSEDATRMRVERALEKLRSRLVRRGIKSTSAALALLLANNAVAATPSGLVTSITATALSNAATSGGIAALTAKLLLMTKTQMAVLGGVLVLLAAVVVMQTAAEQRLHGEIGSLEAQKQKTGIAVEAQRREAQAQVVLSEEAKAKAFDPVQAEIDLLQKKVRQGNLDSQYARLFRRLKLTPEKVEAFKSLLVDWQLAANEASRMATAAGITRYEDIQKIRWAGAEEASEPIRVFLGDESYAYFKFYAENAAARGRINTLDQRLNTRGLGLTDEQYDALVRLRAHGAGEAVMKAMPPTEVESALALLQPDQQRLFMVWNDFCGAWAEISRMNREAAALGKIKLSRATVDKNGNTKFSSP
jgi:RNA polymerase sigma factor (sigma-70 family)